MANDWLLIGLILALELIFSSGVAIWTRWTSNAKLQGQTIWHVAVGVAGVISVAGLRIGFDAVGRLRKQGHLICDLGDGAGRWIASTADEFWEFYRYYVKPIKAKAEVARALKKSAEAQFPDMMQPSLFDYAEMESV